LPEKHNTRRVSVQAGRGNRLQVHLHNISLS